MVYGGVSYDKEPKHTRISWPVCLLSSWTREQDGLSLFRILVNLVTNLSCTYADIKLHLKGPKRIEIISAPNFCPHACKKNIHITWYGSSINLWKVLSMEIYIQYHSIFTFSIQNLANNYVLCIFYMPYFFDWVPQSLKKRRCNWKLLHSGGLK